ncbi:unnamed protein product [Closterium sp. Yama58-4]|nr:unnamed protein product [Closterium sp. Yama58-4]
MAALVAPVGPTLSIPPSSSSRAASPLICSRATLDRPHKPPPSVINAAISAARSTAHSGSSFNQQQHDDRNHNRRWHRQHQSTLQLPTFFHRAPLSPHGTAAILPPRVVRTCARFPPVPAIAAAATGPVSPGASRGPQPPSASSGPAAPTATIAAAAASAAASAAVETAAGAVTTAVAALDLEAQKKPQVAPQVAPKTPHLDSRNTITVRSPVGVDEPPLLRARLTERPVPGQARWQPPAGQPSRCFLPRPLTYSSSLADVDPDEVAHVWYRTLKVEREPRKVMKAMRHSYSIVVVMDESQRSLSGKRGKTIGVGRAISDGSFVATICDVAVLPEYQQKGVGRRIVRKLIQDMQRRGPSGYAVFPPPLARRFFWMMGFRFETNQLSLTQSEAVTSLASIFALFECTSHSAPKYERKYSLMAYCGQLIEPSAAVATPAAANLTLFLPFLPLPSISPSPFHFSLHPFLPLPSISPSPFRFSLSFRFTLSLPFLPLPSISPSPFRFSLSLPFLPLPSLSPSPFRFSLSLPFLPLPSVSPSPFPFSLSLPFRPLPSVSPSPFHLPLSLPFLPLHAPRSLRYERKYSLMAYHGQLMEPSAASDSTCSPVSVSFLPIYSTHSPPRYERKYSLMAYHGQLMEPSAALASTAATPAAPAAAVAAGHSGAMSYSERVDGGGEEEQMERSGRGSMRFGKDEEHWQ